jgi:hypothetical protein
MSYWASPKNLIINEGFASNLFNLKIKLTIIKPSIILAVFLHGRIEREASGKGLGIFLIWGKMLLM